MIICFTTDLHGRANLYKEAAQLVAATDADLLIFGGDMYPDGDMKDPSPMQVQFVRGWLADWIRRLRDERPDCRLATVLGNHDWLCSVEATEELEAEGLLTVLRPDRPAKFGGRKFLGYSYSPPSPFFSKDLERLDRPDDDPPLAGGGRWDPARQRVVEAQTPGYFTSLPSIQEDLAGIPPVDGEWVFVSHSPPYDSKLDLLITGQPVGSHAIREFIERRQPYLSLHGHLHDSPYVSGRTCQRIGKTLAINPGQGTQTLAAVTFDPDDPEATLQGHGIRLNSSG
ncbi:MAG: metallophosphoesterase [Phycisphaerae bacterium]|nr:metallophosphoesterase [Phycisphaerae bacterium]